MSLIEPIGGYFELEVSPRDEAFLHSDAILLNTARNCFEYILMANNVSHVYMPKFTCDVMIEPLKKMNINYTFYSIDDALEIVSDIDIKPNEYIVYTNYFGVKNEYSRHLSDLYKDQLILDCSQAYYFEPLTIGHTIYSPRKFFGLPDGGCLYTSKTLDQSFPVDVSFSRMSHLIKRLELGAEEGYDDFRRNDASLVGQPIKLMSKLTHGLLRSIDIEGAAEKRQANAIYLHESLGPINRFKTPIAPNDGVQMIYPLIFDKRGLRQYLIDRKVFVAVYWPNVLEWCNVDETEYQLASDILALPIDQRYTIDDMDRIVRIIKEYS